MSFTGKDYAVTSQDEGTSEWSPARQWVYGIITSARFDAVLGLVVMSNIVFVVLKTDIDAQYRSGNADAGMEWMEGVGVAYVVVYAVDMGIRIWVLRCRFITPTNLFDLTIVLADIIAEISNLLSLANVPSVSVLRVFRIARLVRAVRFLTAFREVYTMVHGLASALKAVGWATILIFMCLLLWAIVAVEFLHPLSEDFAEFYEEVGCDRCPDAFVSVYQASLTFVQTTIAGDSWGLISLPMMTRYPLTGFIFLGCFITIDLALINLILMVIIDNVEEARRADNVNLLKLKAQETEVAKARLLRICEDLDADGSGSLSLDELYEGFESNPEFGIIMQLMDVGKDDMALVFQLMDNDNSGDVDFTEFVDNLYKMKSSEDKTMLIFIKYYVTEIKVNVGEQLKMLKDWLQSRQVEQEAMIAETLRVVRSLQSAPKFEESSLSDHKAGDKLRQMTDAQRNLAVKQTSGNGEEKKASSMNRHEVDLGCVERIGQEIEELKQQLSRQLSSIQQDVLHKTRPRDEAFKDPLTAPDDWKVAAVPRAEPPPPTPRRGIQPGLPQGPGSPNAVRGPMPPPLWPGGHCCAPVPAQRHNGHAFARPPQIAATPALGSSVVSST